jgi:hypothetical protein
MQFLAHSIINAMKSSADLPELIKEKAERQFSKVEVKRVREFASNSIERITPVFSMLPHNIVYSKKT